MKIKSTRYPPEFIERAVRVVFESRQQYESPWTVIESIAGKIGCTTEKLRR